MERFTHPCRPSIAGNVTSQIINLLRVLPDHRVSIIALCRAAKTQPRWKNDGELGFNDSGAGCVPAFVISRFEGIDQNGRNFESLSDLEEEGLLKLETFDNTGYISILGSSEDSIESEHDPDYYLKQRFDYLSVILRAQPDPFSTIDWEEVTSQLSSTVVLNCVSLLRVISFDDIRRYIALLQQNNTKWAPLISI